MPKKVTTKNKVKKVQEESVVKSNNTKSKIEYKTLVVGIIIGMLFGFFYYNSPIINPEKDTVLLDPTTNRDMMEHSTLEIDPNLPVPSATVKAVKDSIDGYNIIITPENFTLTPENVSNEPVPNTGHYHLYLNNKKIARVYSNYFHLSDSVIPTGENEITVTLNANDHSEWMGEKGHIQATTTITKE